MEKRTLFRENIVTSVHISAVGFWGRGEKLEELIDMKQNRDQWMENY